MSSVFGISPNKNTLTLSLGKTPAEIKNKDSYLFLVIKIAIIKQITRNWLKDNNLINSQLNNLVNEIYGMEKTTMRIRNQMYIFEERWEQWVKYRTL